MRERAALLYRTRMDMHLMEEPIGGHGAVLTGAGGVGFMAGPCVDWVERVPPTGQARLVDWVGRSGSLRKGIRIHNLI
jgi:hypothetical protein